MADEIHVGPPPVQDRSTAELIQDVQYDVRRLARSEVRLATAELRQKGKEGVFGAGAASVAGVTAFFGGAALVVAVIFAFALVLPGWAAALIVSGGLLLLAALLGGVGAFKLKQGWPPIPEETAADVQADAGAVKHGAEQASQRTQS